MVTRLNCFSFFLTKKWQTHFSKEKWEKIDDNIRRDNDNKNEHAKGKILLKKIMKFNC